MAKRKTKKQVTLQEFNAWLEGVEELHPTNWHPDESQWKLIRNKIKNIVPDEPTVVATPVAPGYPIPRNKQPQMPQEELPFAPPPAIPSSVPDASNVTISPEAEALLKGSGGKTITPNIDTSNGNFKSSFS